MTQKYTVPFNIDFEDLIAEDVGKSEEEILSAIKNEGDNHGVEVDTEDMTATGNIESLASFFMMVDGPGPAFIMEEFEDYVREYGETQLV